MKINKVTSLLLIMTLIVLPVTVSGCKKEEKKEEKKPQNVTVEAKEKPEVEEKEQLDETVPRKDILVALDPGHQGWNVDMSEKEPNAPGSSDMKTKATSGTEGNYSGVAEYQLVLDISLMVRDELEAQGYDVLMTREDNDTAISNSERAQKANDAGADVMVRIHANSSEDHSVNGALALVPSASNPYVGALYDQSYQLADKILNSYCQSTGMVNSGIQENDTMTGINWSTIPVMILEMGFMSNESDDLNMEDTAYRQKMVQGIVDGINHYFEQDEAGAELTELSGQINQVIQAGIDAGEQWSVFAKDLSSGDYCIINNQKLQSASVIKLFVAGTVYENMDMMMAQQSQDGETSDLMRTMIANSDNEATNTFVKRLGNGDASAGMQKVNDFCQAHGYADTHMGRLMLASNDIDDNITTVEDCGNLLQDYYKGKIAGSEEILGYMKQQERVTKIPAGVPENTEVANKTGELSDVENDVALITSGDKSYLLCVMSNGVKDTSAAVSAISEVSSVVYNYMIK